MREEAHQDMRGNAAPDHQGDHAFDSGRQELMTQFEEDVATEPAAIADSTERAMEFLQKAGVDARAVHHVALVLEEILTNIATHGGGPAETTKVRIAVEPERVAGEIFDSGPPYDPRTGPTPDLEATLEDRQI